ncbi:hypothetical protein HYU45_04360 [Candidatus Daviesbacteria bacterium]|nr:hypothetical protein [Candidatus Daviesbacteria bacterium]MBI4038054.1 hypothetical protein [Candidatus Daviesbacteria bacterium]
MERFKDRRPRVGESKKRPVARFVVVGLAVLGGTFGVEAATGVVSQTAGKVAVAGKDLLKNGVQAVIEWDDRGFNASSAGIPAQELGGAMKKRDEADRRAQEQTEQDRIESEALRQALNPGPKQFP